MDKIDFNCDMGEGIGNDALIMPFISSASIACGYHAGDPTEMYQAVSLAVKYNVSVGRMYLILIRKILAESK
jgi:UPF0271 protein